MTSMKILLYKLVLPKSGKGNTVEPVYYGHLGTRKKRPDYDGVLIFQVILKEMFHLGPQLSVWIMQVSIFSSVQINRFHCMIIAMVTRVLIRSYCTLHGQD